MKPFLRPAARADLAAIWTYGADEWGEDAADAYIRAIDDALNHTARHPMRGNDRSNVLPGLRKADVANHHAYYLTTAAGIDVIRILHPRMDATTAISPP